MKYNEVVIAMLPTFSLEAWQTKPEHKKKLAGSEVAVTPTFGRVGLPVQCSTTFHNINKELRQCSCVEISLHY